MSEIHNDDLCQCPICGRMHRLLGNPPKSVMAQIARDIQEGVFPRKSAATLSEEKPRYFVSQYTDGPATRWNVIDRKTQEWVCRYTTEAEAQKYADELNSVA